MTNNTSPKRKRKYWQPKDDCPNCGAVCLGDWDSQEEEYLYECNCGMSWYGWDKEAKQDELVRYRETGLVKEPTTTHTGEGD